MDIPTSKFRMESSRYQGPDWVGIREFRLFDTTKPAPRFRSEKPVFTVEIGKYSSGATPKRFVELYAAYRRGLEAFTACSWAPHHMIEEFGSLARAMDTIFEAIMVKCETGDQQAGLLKAGIMPATRLTEDFRLLNHHLTAEASRRETEGTYGYALSSLRALEEARRVEGSAYSALHSTYSNVMAELSAPAR